MTQGKQKISTLFCKPARRILFFLPAVTLLLLCCAPTINRYYPGRFFEQDNVYKNRPLRFTLAFEGNWNIQTSIEQMSRTNRNYAVELHENGLELLFVGSTVEGFHGTRAIAANFNKSALEHALHIQDLNAAFLDNDYGLEDFSDQREMIRWMYEKSGFLFTEYFFTLNTYNVRVTFWSLPEHFENFIAVYERIIGSLQEF